MPLGAPVTSSHWIGLKTTSIYNSHELLGWYSLFLGWMMVDEMFNGFDFRPPGDPMTDIRSIHQSLLAPLAFNLISLVRKSTSQKLHISQKDDKLQLHPLGPPLNNCALQPCVSLTSLVIVSHPSRPLPRLCAVTAAPRRTRRRCRMAWASVELSLG